MTSKYYPELPLEDDFEDILGKSIRGRNIHLDDLAEQTGVSRSSLRKALEGQFKEEDVPKLASALSLNPKALLVCAKKEWRPKPVTKWDGFEMDATRWKSMVVNSYIVWDPETLKAAFFDSGASAVNLINLAHKKNLDVESVFLTHTHGDHVADVDRILRETSAKTMYISKQEPHAGAQLFQPGTEFEIGKLKVQTRLTCGHSEGGITYVIQGLRQKLAIVGDAIFAGSMGGGKISFEDALRTSQSEIMTLDEDTVLAPGHGPLSSVGEEKIHNPFLAS